ncbi:MAG TPA: DUF1330 domain-containing protein [Thermomicrobiales bacterium]
MAAYLVVDTDWKDTDGETRAAFGRAAQPVIAAHGGKFLTPPGTNAEPLEGDWQPPIVTIIEFPDVESAKRLWNSPEFRAAAEIRRATNAVFKIVLVDGAPADRSTAAS